MAKRRSKSQITRDLKRIGELYLQGRYQHEIAEELGLSTGTISNDLKRLHAEWRESAATDIEKKKSEELSKIDHLERTYWEGWLRSCEDEVVTTERFFEVDGEEKSETTVKTKPRDGNTKFLDGVDKCVRQRCKILGVEAPTEHEVGPRLGTILGALPDSLRVGVLEVLSSEGEKK
jgi:hypothetical protein